MAQEPDYSTSPKPISQLKTAADLSRKLDSLRRGRQPLDNQWRVNLAFYKGRQYTYWNRHTNRIETKPVDEGEMPRYIVRLVSNQILTGAHSLLAKYIKTKPVMTAAPGSGSSADFKAAQMAEKLLEHLWDHFDLDEKLEEALLWSIITGQGYWKITWDPHAGTPMKFLLDPMGNPIIEDSLKDVFRAELEQAGVPPQEQTVYMGDIRVETLSPFQVYIDPSAQIFEDAKYVICIHSLDPDEVKYRWGKDVKPDSISAPQDATLPFGKSSESEPNVKQVCIGYFLPSPALPNGRYVVWTEKPHQILEDGPWPYAVRELPIVKFPGVRVPGQIYDSSVVEHAIPLQKELNRTISQIVEYKNLTIKPRVWAPYGSVSTRITAEPGALYEYAPYDNHKPEVERLPTMPPYVFDHLNGIRNGLKDVFALTEVTEGQLPPNLEAGVAIDLLQEMATDRLAPTIKLLETAIERAGQIMLSLAQEYYIEPRQMQIYGSGGSIQVKRFSQADINGGITINVEAGSALPRTRAGRQMRIMDYIDKGILRPEHAYKYLDMGDMEGVAREFAADEDHANRELQALIEGEPINPEAMQQAIIQLQQGINPETGQPLQPGEDPQQIVEKASLQPLSYENSQTHDSVMHLYMVSPEFAALPPHIKQRFVIHDGLTKEALQTQSLAQPEPVAPRVTLQLKGTTGPTGASAILNKSGVHEVTPEVMTEPPLETWVTDSMDKIDTDEAGNDPLTDQEVQMKQQEMLHKEQSQTANLALSQQKLRHEQEKADADRQQQLAKIALEAKRVEQSDFRPKRASDG
jgi:hypothetical protein